MRSRISKWGNSLAVRLPRGIIEESGLVEGSDVELTLRDGRIVIAPVGPEYQLHELVEGITSENRPTETDWGRPTGNEVW